MELCLRDVELILLVDLGLPSTIRKIFAKETGVLQGADYLT